MYGYYVDIDRYVDSWSSEVFATEGKNWHEQADRVAGYNLRLAARCRDIANAVQALNMLARDMKAQRTK